jgi:hypothetical protein
MLARELCSRANIVIPPESNLLIKLIRQGYSADQEIGPGDWLEIKRIIHEDRKFTDWDLPVNMLEDRLTLPIKFGSLLEEVFTAYVERKGVTEHCIFGIKKGSFSPYYKQIKAVFPGSKFIILIRDGRAIFSSQKRSLKSTDGLPFESDVRKSVSYWNDAMRLFDEIALNYPGDTFVVKYEDLVSDDGQEAINDILKFIGTSPKPAVFEYSIPERYGSELHKNVDKPPINSRRSKWKNELSEYERSYFTWKAWKSLEKYEYDDNRPSRTKFLGMMLKKRFSP